MQNILQGLCPYKIYYSTSYDEREREKERGMGWTREINNTINDEHC